MSWMKNQMKFTIYPRQLLQQQGHTIVISWLNSLPFCSIRCYWFPKVAFPFGLQQFLTNPYIKSSLFSWMDID
jgi:hypothetical protein